MDSHESERDKSEYQTAMMVLNRSRRRLVAANLPDHSKKPPVVVFSVTWYRGGFAEVWLMY